MRGNVLANCNGKQLEETAKRRLELIRNMNHVFMPRVNHMFTLAPFGQSGWSTVCLVLSVVSVRFVNLLHELELIA